jgi:glutamine amidotransferase
MCELMGLSFESPVQSSFSFHPFAMRSRENADGWGLAWYPDRSLAFVKEPLSWSESLHARFVEQYEGIRSSLYIAHVRKKTVGSRTYADTHPFHREFGGREYCFVHNGTITDAHDLPLGRFLPMGNTDSECLFCHLLARLQERDRHLDEPADWRWLHATLGELNAHGKLNCLMSDGVRLFGYHDQRGWKSMKIRKLGTRNGRPRHLGDESVEVDLNGSDDNHGVVLASKALDNFVWHPLCVGELVVLEGSRLRFSSHHRRRPKEMPA